LEIIDDFLVEDNRTKWIGVFIKFNKKYLVILNENVHNWLKELDNNCYIGFR